MEQPSLEEIIEEAIRLGKELNIDPKNAFYTAMKIQLTKTKLNLAMDICNKCEENYKKIDLLTFVNELILRGYHCKSRNSDNFFQNWDELRNIL